LVKALRRDLDQGEAESIALALELNATLLLLDEKEGRHIAERLGLRVVGVVGVLLEAKAKGVIDRVRPHLDALRQTAGFFLSEPVYQSALVLANEEGRSE
jgi:predicted nucleic acid-binding protein